MSKGTCADVVQEVKNVIQTLGLGGGLILASNHTIQATPRAVDNSIAYYWAAEKFRNYPINLGPNRLEEKSRLGNLIPWQES